MSAPTAGTAQPILSEHGLVAFVRLYMEQVLNAFPIQAEFGPAVPTNYDQLVVEIEETIRSTGSFDSKPTKATEEALERFSKVIVKALFQHKRYEYPTHALTQMRDLRVLEEADLVLPVRKGRERFNYLNPVPIQQVYERWVSQYMQPWADALTSLKHGLEERAARESKGEIA